MSQPKDWREMVDWSAKLLKRRTGAGVTEWDRRARDSGIETEPELRAWLTERGVTGYAQMVVVMERFGYPDFLLATADELIDGQYADRADLRPILDRLLAAALGVGDVQIQARKTYVTLVTPRRQFALVKPTTRRRVDLGLRLPGGEPGGRLESARLLGSDVMTIRIPLHSVDDVDDEVVDWVRRTYAANV